MPTRKQFLQTTTVALAGIPFTTLWQCRQAPTDPPIACVTGEDILGPFYRAEAPFRTALNVLNQMGSPHSHSWTSAQQHRLHHSATRSGG